MQGENTIYTTPSTGMHNFDLLAYEVVLRLHCSLFRIKVVYVFSFNPSFNVKLLLVYYFHNIKVARLCKWVIQIKEHMV